MSLPSNCPLCKSAAANLSVVTNRVYGKHREQAFFKCNECDVIFLFPSLTPEEEHRFYAKEFEGFMAGRAGISGKWHTPVEHIEANEEQRLRRMVYLDEFTNGGSSSILEIGCSSGFMLYPLIGRGHKCVGVEPSGAFGPYVRSRGVACHDSFEELLTDNRDRFDLIMHFFVMEHIGDPIGFLQSQIALLNKGGRLVVEIPNAADALHTVYDIPEFERFYWSVAHAWYFTEKSLRFLLDKLGYRYRIVLDQRYDLSNHMIWARDGRPGGMGRFTDVLGGDFERQYKDALIRAGACDTLVAIIETDR